MPDQYPYKRSQFRRWYNMNKARVSRSSLLVVLSLFGLFVLKSCWDQASFVYPYQKVTIGTVQKVRINETRPQYSSVDYIYEVNGHYHTGSISAMGMMDTLIQYLPGKKFPVVYNGFSRWTQSYSFMLIAPWQFQGYPMGYPDSVSWIADYWPAPKREN